jgi:predicted NUDIX family NTP pyrophosphohydrolase
MPPRTSAGILLHRLTAGGERQVLLGHMGGPFWARKDDGAWSIPKGEHGPDEEPFAVACREFEEELGSPVPATEFLDLGQLRVTSGKVLAVWAAAGDLDAAASRSNTFTIEWPPRSGRMQEFPEIDRSAWFAVAEARVKLVKGQVPFLDRLLAQLPGPDAPAGTSGPGA